MKQIIENLLKDGRKTKAELAEFLKVTPQGLQYKLKEDAWKHNELQMLAEFFGVDMSLFIPKNEIQGNTENFWERIIKEKDLRIDELAQSLNDARYIISLQKSMLSKNFNVVSKKSPVFGEMKVIRGDKKPVEESVQIA